MKNKYSILICVAAVAVNLSNGYSIKEPGGGAFSASFSGSSASSSAFSHSSSNSYTFNGNVNPNDVAGLTEKLKAAAVAGASAGALAGTGGGTGAHAGAGASAGAFAGAGANAGAGASAGALAGASAGSLTGSGADAGDAIASGGSDEYSGGANAGSGAISGASGCSSGSACGAGQDSNAIGGGSSSSAADTGAYKVVGGDKYTTGYSSAPKTNYAVSGNYVQGTPASGNYVQGASNSGNYVQGASNSGNYAHGSSNTAGGCSSCKGPFPGSSGSIHDYKIPSSVPAAPHAGGAPSVQPIHPTGAASNAFAAAGAGAGASTSSGSINHLPGGSGSIYDSKPATAHSGTNYNSGSGYVSPSLIATLPGPSGSIYDSKPASAGFGPQKHGPGPQQLQPLPLKPVATPSCAYSPGSPNCGAAPAPIKPVGPGLSGIIAVLPGPSGSIYNSKPATGVHGAGAVAGSGSSSGSYHGTGSITNIPAHPVAAPGCSYSPGSPNKCGPSIPSGAIAGAGAAANAGAQAAAGGYKGPFPGPTGSIHEYKPAPSISFGGIHGGSGSSSSSSIGGSGSYNNAGSVTNIPSSHPIVGPVCSYSPGSPNKCGSNVPQHGGPSGAIAGAGASANAGSGAAAETGGYKGPFPGPSGSIYDSKPVPSASSGSIQSGSGSGSVATSGPACSYAPGSPNKCGSGVPQQGGASYAGAGASAAADAQAGAGGCLNCKGPFPGPSGSIHDYKPVSSPPSSSSGSGISFHGIPIDTGIVIAPQPIGVTPPSIHPEVPSGTYYVNKPATDVEPPVSGSGPSFSGQIPCADSSCESIKNSPVAPAPSSSSGDCGSGSGCGGATGSGSGSYAGSQSSSGSTAINGQYQTPLAPAPSSSSGDCGSGSGCGGATGSGSGSYTGSQSSSGSTAINDQYQTPVAPAPSSSSGDCGFGSGCGGATGSGSGSYSGSQSSSGSTAISGQYQSGIVYPNDDGSYNKAHTPSKPIYKNAEQGGYAVSSDSADNTGVLVGPGTGNLPIEADKESKPFGTQGAFGGSAAFAKGAAATNDKPFGTQGAFGGSTSFSGSSASAQSLAENHATDITVTKAEEVIAAEDKPACATGNCGFGSDSSTGSGSSSGNSYSNGEVDYSNKESGTPVKLQCTGASCEDTEVYVIQEKPSKPNSYGSYSGTGSANGFGSADGFATGQVLVNTGGNTYDVTNSGSNALGGAYSGSQSGSYSGNSLFGCSSCGGGHGFGASFGLSSSGGFLDKLFGAGGLSGNVYNRFSGQGGSAAFSNAGSYAGANTGSFARAGASASAQSGSYVHSF